MKVLLIIFLFLSLICNYSQNLTSTGSKLIYYDSSHSIYLDTTEIRNSIYVNKDLGFQFRFDEFDYSPVFEVKASSRTTEWKEYSSKRFGLRFKYPEQLIVKLTQTIHYGTSIFDSTIQIGCNIICYKPIVEDEGDSNNPYPMSDSGYVEFLPIIEIYLTQKNISEVAKENFFEIGDSLKQDKYQKINNGNIGHGWKSRIYGAYPEKADFLDGKEWQGLRNQNYFSTNVFLLKKCSDSYRIVTTYFDGKRNIYCSYCNQINEHHFYLIIDSIRML